MAAPAWVTDRRAWTVVEEELSLRAADGDEIRDIENAFVVVPATRAHEAEAKLRGLATEVAELGDDPDVAIVDAMRCYAEGLLEAF